MASLTAEQLQLAIDVGCRCNWLGSLKSEKLDVVRLLLQDKSLFVILPTGFGKSAIFHILPFCASSLLPLLW